MLDKKLLEIYDYCQEFGDIIIVEKDDKCGIIDSNYNIIQELKYDKISIIENVYIIAKIGFKECVINKKGQQICDAKYDLVNECNNGYYTIKLNGKWGVMNEKGEEIVPFKYDYIYDFNNDGFAKVRLAFETFYIDVSGKEYNQIINYIER